MFMIWGLRSKYKEGKLVSFLYDLSTDLKIFGCVYNIYISITVGYVEELFTMLWEVMQKNRSVKVKRVTAPPPLCSSLEKPNKKEAIAKHKSRFSK